jgi:hypothetical protein
MKKIITDLKLNLSKLPTVDIRLVVFVITLVMFVVGAGAPDAGGGIIK